MATNAILCVPMMRMEPQSCLRARNDNITPEQLIDRYRKEHERDFADFNISFDNYYTTHSPENRELAEHIYLQLKKGWTYSTKDDQSGLRPR